MNQPSKSDLERWITNLEYALKWWEEEVKPETVNLTIWSCGTIACFGGHVAKNEFFKKQGVVADTTYKDGKCIGYPTIPDFMYFPSNVALYLFGNFRIFEASTRIVSHHHAEVIQRIKTTLSSHRSTLKELTT